MNVEPLSESILVTTRKNPLHRKLVVAWPWQHFWSVRTTVLMAEASGYALQGRISQERWKDR